MTNNQTLENFTAGDYVKIETDVNCIPSGIYEFVGNHNGTNHFKVSNKICFTITEHDSVKLRKVLPRSKGKRTRVGSQAFLDRYYELLGILCKTDSFDPTQPYTMCAIDPSLAREFN